MELSSSSSSSSSSSYSSDKFHSLTKREQSIVPTLQTIPGVLDSSVNESTSGYVHLYKLPGVENDDELDAYKEAYIEILRRVHDHGIVHGRILPSTLYVSTNGQFAAIAHWRNALQSTDKSRQEKDYKQLDDSFRTIQAYLENSKTSSFSSGGVLPPNQQPTPYLEQFIEDINLQESFPIPTNYLTATPETRLLTQKMENLSEADQEKWLVYTKAFIWEKIRFPFEQWSIPCLNTWEEVQQYFTILLEIIFLLQSWNNAKQGLGLGMSSFLFSPNNGTDDNPYMRLDEGEPLSQNEYQLLDQTLYHRLVQEVRSDLFKIAEDIKVHLHCLSFWLAKTFTDNYQKGRWPLPCFRDITWRTIVANVVAIDQWSAAPSATNIETNGKKIYDRLMEKAAYTIAEKEHGSSYFPSGFQSASTGSAKLMDVQDTLDIELNEIELHSLARRIMDNPDAFVIIEPVENPNATVIEDVKRYRTQVVRNVVREYFPKIVQNMYKVISYHKGPTAAYSPSERLDEVPTHARHTHFVMPKGVNMLEVYADLNNTPNYSLEKAVYVPEVYRGAISLSIPLNPIRIQFQTAEGNWRTDTKYVFDYTMFGQYTRNDTRDIHRRGSNANVYYYDVTLYARLVALLDLAADKNEQLEKPPPFLRQKEMVPDMVDAERKLLQNTHFSSSSSSSNKDVSNSSKRTRFAGGLGKKKLEQNRKIDRRRDRQSDRKVK
jgi:hypothetical protein